MSNTANRLALYEAVLTLIEHKREETGDERLGDSLERLVMESQIHELEAEILENPEAIEPWLVRRRKGE